MATDPVKARARGALDRVLEEAEILFGKHGIDGVSMRQIQLAAGSSNNFVVQYHFGGTAGLVQAILEKRTPAVDARQAMLLAHAEADGRDGDTRTLIDALFRPLLEQVNKRGERSYARFISALLRSPDGKEHCRALFHLTPTNARIIDRLRIANPQVPRDILDERLRLLSAMVYASVFNRLERLDGPDVDALMVDDALDVAAAGLRMTPGAAGLSKCIADRVRSGTET